MSVDPGELAPGKMPEAEVTIDIDLARRLLASQHADLAEHALVPAANGWDNVMIRVGDALAVRLPRRRVAATLMDKELRWLAEVAAGLPIGVPVPVRSGRPDIGYPWRWSIVPWFEGAIAGADTLDPATAAQWGRLLAALHRTAPPDAPTNPVRGVPLGSRRSALRPRLDRLRAMGIAAVDIDAAERAFEAGADAELDTTGVWIHGDLHPGNLVAADGRLVAVLDWGDVCVGDPATDLASVWMLYDPAAHPRFWESYGPVSEATRTRARGWAAALGVVLYDTGLGTDDAFEANGRATLVRVAARDRGAGTPVS